MKRIVFAIAVSMITFTATAQVSVDEIPVEREFSIVFSSDVPINQKMLNAKTWIATTFGDYKAVLQYEDIENHRIIIKGKTIDETTDGTWYTSNQYSFTMTFDFKEDRYRIKLEDIDYSIGVNIGKAAVPDTPISWEQRYSVPYRVARRVSDLEKEQQTLEQKSLPKNLTTRQKKEYEEKTAKRLEEITSLLANQEDMIEKESRLVADNETDFKVVFSQLLCSAVKRIELDDEF